MGTDIHGGFIKVTGGMKNEGVLTKEAVKSSWDMNRNYTLFAILAGVRNGHGFAGCYRHEPLIPVAEGRGKPDFITFKGEDETDDLYNKWYGSRWTGDDESEFGEWLGDHSFTYMTVKEILDWNGWDKHLSRGGVVDSEHYEETVSKGLNPTHWSGGVGGVDTNVAESVEKYIPVIHTHVACHWTDEESLRDSHKYFLDEIRRINGEHGEDTYLVIGFDS